VLVQGCTLPLPYTYWATASEKKDECGDFIRLARIAYVLDMSDLSWYRTTTQDSAESRDRVSQRLSSLAELARREPLGAYYT